MCRYVYVRLQMWGELACKWTFPEIAGNVYFVENDVYLCEIHVLSNCTDTHKTYKILIQWH